MVNPFYEGKVGSDKEALAKKAIKQIRSKNYGQSFWDDSRPRFFLGVGLGGKDIEHNK